MDKKMLVVCGPTATGKTQLAIELAKMYDGELVSADSRQVYKGMDIATGKDLPKNFKFPACTCLRQELMAGRQFSINIKNKNFQLRPYDIDGINVWMYDVVDPDEQFSVFHYQTLAGLVIENIHKRGKLPIVVGGTGLYISALLCPFETSHIPPNSVLRKQLEQYSLKKLQELLCKNNPVVWEQLNQSDRQNPRRLIRKIEIAEFERLKSSKILDSKTVRQEELNTFIIGLTAPYPFLYQRIDQRVEKRITDGVLNEIQSLLKKGYTWDLPSMNTFGYKEWKECFIVPHTSSLISQAIQRWKHDEHGYVRRQLVWFRNMKNIVWFDITDLDYRQKIESAIHSWYT